MTGLFLHFHYLYVEKGSARARRRVDVRNSNELVFIQGLTKTPQVFERLYELSSFYVGRFLGTYSVD
jgi:hypothetical protein